MPIIKITPAMKMASEAWKEGWVKLRLKEIISEPSANKDSVNFMPIFYDPETGKELSKYAYIMNNKNEAMFGANLVPLAQAVLNRPVEVGEDVDPDKFREVDLWVELQKKPYKGKMVDAIVGFSNKDVVPF